MKVCGIVLLLAACLVIAQCQEKIKFDLDKPQPPKIGEPQYSLQAGGGGRNLNNFGAGYNAGVGTKVWESKNKGQSLELGVNYGRGFQRVQGHTYKSPPSYGVGGTFRWGKK